MLSDAAYKPAPSWEVDLGMEVSACACQIVQGRLERSVLLVACHCCRSSVKPCTTFGQHKEASKYSGALH